MNLPNNINRLIGLIFKALAVEEMHRLKISNIHFGREFDVAFGCYSTHLSEKGARLVEYINQAIAEIIKDGTYKTLLQENPYISILE